MVKWSCRSAPFLNRHWKDSETARRISCSRGVIFQCAQCFLMVLIMSNGHCPECSTVPVKVNISPIQSKIDYS